MKNTWYSRAAVCMVKGKRATVWPCLTLGGPTLGWACAHREGRGWQRLWVCYHRIQKTDSLPFLRCWPWSVVVAHRTGQALAFPVPWISFPGANSWLSILGTHTFFSRGWRENQHEDEWPSMQGKNENTGNSCPWFNFQGHKSALETRTEASLVLRPEPWVEEII